MEFANLFDKMKGIKVLVLGDVMIDRYISGKVDRISPEAPVPVISHSRTDDRLGGAANVALNLQALGATPIMCSLVGNDETGEKMLGLFEKRGLNSEYIKKSNHRRTTIKTRIIGNNQHLLRVDKEDTYSLFKEEFETFTSLFDKALEEENIEILLLQDYNKGMLSPAMIDYCISRARAKGIFIAVDPKNLYFFEYREVDLFKPNLHEIATAFQREQSAEPDHLAEIAKALRSRIRNRYTLITLSENGLFIDDGQNKVVVPTKKRNIVDVCGAGDTVLSISSLLLYLGVSPEMVGHAANTAGGQVCERVGVVPVDADLLKKELEFVKV